MNGLLCVRHLAPTLVRELMMRKCLTANISAIRFCELVIIAICMLPHRAFAGEPPDDLFAAVKENRTRTYHECHATLDVFDSSGPPIKIEVWCKGNKLRNDFPELGENVFCIVSDGTYIQQLPGETIVTRGEVTIDNPKTKMVHPGLIGCVEGALCTGNLSSSKWVFQDLFALGEDRTVSDLERNASTCELQISQSFAVPKVFTIEELAGFASFKDFLKANPEREISKVATTTRITFRLGKATDLLSIKTIQREDGVEDNVQEIENDYVRLPGIEAPIIKRSTWTVLYGEKLVSSRRIEVNSIDFEPVDDSVFTIAGLSPKDGLVVRDRIEAPQGFRFGTVANGEVKYPEEVETRELSSRDSGWRPALLSINFALILAIVFFLLFRHLRFGKGSAEAK